MSQVHPSHTHTHTHARTQKSCSCLPFRFLTDDAVILMVYADVQIFGEGISVSVSNLMLNQQKATEFALATYEDLLAMPEAQEQLQLVSHHHFLNIYLYVQLPWLLYLT